MKSQHPTLTASGVRVTAVNASEQTRRVEDAIARRAYEIFERRGGMGRHELEDWRMAESEIRNKFCIGVTSSEDSALVSCNIGRFEKDSVEIWVAPQQITICGKPVRQEKQAPTADSYQGLVFRVVALPVEIEPRGVFTTARQHFLEIHLPMIHAQQKSASRHALRDRNPLLAVPGVTQSCVPAHILSPRFRRTSLQRRLS